MVKGNVIYINIERRFTHDQRQMIEAYVETYDELLKSKAAIVYGRSDASEEYCVVMKGEEVLCHIAKIDKHYVIDCHTTGYREGTTLQSGLITRETPRMVAELFEHKRKAFA